MSDLQSFSARSSPGGGGGPRGPLFAPRRRRGRRLVALTALGALVFVPLTLAGSQAAPNDVAAPAARAPAMAFDPGDAGRDATTGTDVFAEVGGLELALPGTDAVLIGYHEASFVDALAMDPVGQGLVNENRTKFELPPTRPGPGYLILSSRGRSQAATSAVDIVMRDDEQVLSPVTGRVVDVAPYRLYGRYDDTRVELQPTDNPDLRVVLIHIADVRVTVGDTVEAGTTVIAGTANRFPFASHIDRYFPEDRWPHVHVEVKPATAVRPTELG